MIHETVVTQETGCRHFHRGISWGAIILGALVAVGLSFLLNLFSLAIGISAFTLNQTGANVAAIGSLLGILIGVIVSMLVAGYTAGYFAHFQCHKRNLGIVYGFATWVLALIFSAALAAPMGGYVASYTNNAAPNVNVSTKHPGTAPAVSVETTSTSTAKESNKKTVNVQTNAGTIAWGVFSIFMLFFIGAFSSCLGGIWGMHCKRDDDIVHTL
ncbi:MAG: hypothetical protein WC785_10775 [Tatlockia sp.]|jgi:hypothetical protein